MYKLQLFDIVNKRRYAYKYFVCMLYVCAWFVGTFIRLFRPIFRTVLSNLLMVFLYILISRFHCLPVNEIFTECVMSFEVGLEQWGWKWVKGVEGNVVLIFEVKCGQWFNQCWSWMRVGGEQEGNALDLFSLHHATNTIWNKWDEWIIAHWSLVKGECWFE